MKLVLASGNPGKLREIGAILAPLSIELLAQSALGIAEADRDRLFARFARGQDADSDGGSGLGLYVSRELCRAMGGDLVLESSRPGGSTFLWTVPVQVASPPG